MIGTTCVAEIDPIDRRCYAFFHPALVDEPLIFVEVALTESIPGAIAPLLAEDRPLVPTVAPAPRYSIRSPTPSAASAAFPSGSFLIKQVVEELQRELPKLENFVTLSPVPDFMDWVKQADDVPITDDDRAILQISKR